MHDVPYFDRLAPAYDLATPAADAADLEAGLALADGSVERVLDVGGGTGRAARALSVPEAVVVDASGPMLRHARGHGLDCLRGDAATLPVRDGAVDAVLVVREFDPHTLRGRALVAAEHLVGFGSTFYRPADLGGRMAAAGLDPSVLDRGFGYTVAGRRTEPGPA